MLLLNLLLTLAWMLLTGAFSPLNFLIGFLLSFAMLWLVGGSISDNSSRYVQRLLQIPSFIIFFLAELIKANLRVMLDVVTPKHQMVPGIVAIPLDVQGDLEITLLANLITLTPGTLSLDVSDDCKVLYVHSMYIYDPDTFRRGIKENLERRIIELLR
jgi:multicomponent Na+:H+ antiporter subunit E